MKNFYERYWDGKLPPMKLFGDPPKWEPECIKRYIQLVKPWIKHADLLLDYGCGEGHFIHILQQNNMCHSAGIDISEKAIERAKKLYPCSIFRTLGDQVTTKFDVITCFDVMEHIFDFDDVFDFITPHLQVGGRLIIATNEMCFLKMVAIGIFYMDTFFHPYSPHLRFFTKKTLKELLESKGYKVIHYDRIANHFGFLSTGQFVVAERIK